MANDSVPLALDHISEEKIKRLKQHPRLLAALDQWVLFADRRLIPEMRELGRIVKALYHLPNALTLYRGFRLGGFQDTLGVPDNAHVGQVLPYKSDERSLSFSTNEDIAQAFGNVVVSTTVNPNKVELLWITDELVVILHEMRNLNDIMTQHEVILLPPIEMQMRVVSFEKSKLGWLGW